MAFCNCKSIESQLVLSITLKTCGSVHCVISASACLTEKQSGLFQSGFVLNLLYGFTFDNGLVFPSYNYRYPEHWLQIMVIPIILLQFSAVGLLLCSALFEQIFATVQRSLCWYVNLTFTYDKLFCFCSIGQTLYMFIIIHSAGLI
jgi:hypothetical protein